MPTLTLQEGLNDFCEALERKLKIKVGLVADGRADELRIIEDAEINGKTPWYFVKSTDDGSVEIETFHKDFQFLWPYIEKELERRKSLKA